VIIMQFLSAEGSARIKKLQVVIIMQFLSAEGSARIGEEIETIEMAIGFQGVAMQKTEEKEEVLSGLLPCDKIPLPHEKTRRSTAQKTGEKPGEHHHHPFRQHALVMREIPLLKIPAALQRDMKDQGGRVYRIGIVHSFWNHYTIKIRCNPKKAVEHYVQLRNTDQLVHNDHVEHTDHVVRTDQVVHTEQSQNKEQSQNMDQTNTTGTIKCGDGP